MIGEFIGEIVGKVFLEGLSYLTGKGILRVVSFGRLQTTLDPPRPQRFTTTFIRDGKRYVHHSIAMAIGLLFWGAIISLLVLHFQGLL